MKKNILRKKYFLFFISMVFINGLLGVQKDSSENERTILVAKPKPTKKPKRKRMTQIEAQLSIPWIYKKVEKKYNISNFRNLINQMNKTARANMKTSYDFYHAQTSDFRIIQDTYKKLYEILAIKAQIKNFTFLRFRDPIFEKYDNIGDLLKDELRNKGLIDDNNKEVRTNILSVNLSPFGNVGTPGEATFYYFLHGVSHMDPSWLLEDFFNKVGLGNKYLDDFRELGKSIQTKEGSLFQIFIPKKKVDQICYLAWRHGVPYDTKIIKDLFGGIFAKNDTVTEELQAINKAYEAGIKVFSRYLDRLIKKINEGKFRISKILDTYRTDPRKINDLNTIQGRLLLSNNMLLNPDSGITIYRYTTIPENKMIEYEKELSKLIDKIVLDWLTKIIEEKETKITTAEMERLKALVSLIKQGRNLEDIDAQTILNHVKVLQELKEKAKTGIRKILKGPKEDDKPETTKTEPQKTESIKETPIIQEPIEKPQEEEKTLTKISLTKEQKEKLNYQLIMLGQAQNTRTINRIIELILKTVNNNEQIAKKLEGANRKNTVTIIKNIKDMLD